MVERVASATTSAAGTAHIASLAPHAVQDTKSLLDQVLRTHAIQVLGVGLAADSQLHDTVEYAEFPQKMKGR